MNQMQMNPMHYSSKQQQQQYKQTKFNKMSAEMDNRNIINTTQ